MNDKKEARTSTINWPKVARTVCLIVVAICFLLLVANALWFQSLNGDTILWVMAVCALGVFLCNRQIKNKGGT